MKLKSEMHRRRSIRLKGYDYSQRGAYFITICVNNRKCLLGDISADGLKCSNEMGRIVLTTWHDLPKHYPCMTLDAFTIMPNHVHGILFLSGSNMYKDTNSGEDVKVGTGIESGDDIFVGAGFKPAPTSEMIPAVTDIAWAGLKPAPTENGKMAGDRKIRHGLSEIVRAFKTFSSRQINAQCGMRGHSFWQRNYYEHVIRDEEELNRARQYIMDNAKKWMEDKENPINMKSIG